MAILKCSNCKRETVHNKCTPQTKTMGKNHRCAVCHSYRNDNERETLVENK